MSDSRQKTALVTGASSGIGRAIASTLSEAGLRVLGSTRLPSKQDLEVPWEWVELDLRDDASITRLAEFVGEVDFLINNAGKAYLSSVIDGDPGQWDEMWQVNVRGLARVTQALLPQMRAGGGIINVSSMSGHRVPPSGGFYSPTKFAVRALTESLRLELRGRGSDIRVGSISPGFVDTPLLGDYFAGREEALSDLKSSSRLLDPADIARLVRLWVESPPHVEYGDIALRSVSQSV